MKKFISKDLGKNAVSAYKRASNILEQEKIVPKNGPDAVFLNMTKKKNFLRELM